MARQVTFSNAKEEVWAIPWISPTDTVTVCSREALNG